MTAQPGVPQLLRVINDRAALDLLVERGPLSRTEVGQLTGLSHPTATRLLARLLGVKHTTLNAKIKRYKILCVGDAGDADKVIGDREMAA